MKFNEKNFKIIIILLMLVVFVVSFRFGYSNFNDKKDGEVKQTRELAAQLADLQEKASHKEEYEAEVQRAKDMVEEKLGMFGPGNTPEKSILYVVDLEKEANMEVSAIGFGAESVLSSSELIPTELGVGASLCVSPLTLSIQTDYAGVKKAVDFINAAAEKKNISSLSLTFNQETGFLSGTMVVNEYAVYGLGKEYVKPQVDGPTGVSNIFSLGE